MDGQPEKKPHIIPVLESSTPNLKATRVTRDNSFARIVVSEKEDLTNEEIHELLNIRSFTKADIDKHFERGKDGVDKHMYTIYNILI